MLKRIFSICLIVSLSLFVSPSITSYAYSTYESELLIDLGILKPKEGSRIFPSTYTRSDFALTLSMMDGIPPAEYEIPTKDLEGSTDDTTQEKIGVPSIANDIEKDKNYDAIVEMITANYMAVENGQFRPKDPISMKEAVVAIMRILGYEEAIKEEGGEVSDYISIASKIGLLKGIELTYGVPEYDTIARLILNAMNARICNYGLHPYMGYSTLFELWEIKENVGIVMANSNFGIYVSPRSSSVYINGKYYATQVAVDNELVGASVVFYTRIIEGRETVVSIKGTTTESNVTLNASEIDAVSDKGSYLQITYETKKKVNLSKSAYMTINKKTVSPQKLFFDKFTSGTVTFIDTNSDGIYDLAHMNFFKQGVLKGVNSDGLKMLVNIDGTNETVNLEDLNFEEIIYGKRLIKPAELKEGMVVGIGVDKFSVIGDTIQFDYDNAECVTVLASDKKEEGYVDKISNENKVFLGDMDYMLSAGYQTLIDSEKLLPLSPGMYVTLYMDGYGTVLTYDTDLEKNNLNYGYLIAAKVNRNGFQDELFMKIMNRSGVIEEYKTKNEKFILDGLRINISTTGVTYNVAGNQVDFAKRQLIRFKGSDGIIYEVDTKQIRPGYEDKNASLYATKPFDFYGTDQVASRVVQGALGRSFTLKQDCLVFVDDALASDTSPDEKRFSVQNLSVFDSSTNYYIEGFNATDYNEIPCIVYYRQYGRTEGSQIQPSLPHNLCSSYVVEKVWDGMNKEGAIGYYLSLAGPDGKKELFAPDDLDLYRVESDADWNADRITVHKCDSQNFKSIIKPGDILRYTVTSNNEIDYIEKLFDFESHKNILVPLPNRGGTTYGYVNIEKTNENTIMYSYGSLLNNPEETTYVFNKRSNYTSVPVFDVNTGKVTMTEYKNLPSSFKGDTVKAFLRYYDNAWIFDYIFYLY